MLEENKNKIIWMFDDAMRLGAALGDFKAAGEEGGMPYRPWLRRAAKAAFEAAQKELLFAVEETIREDAAAKAKDGPATSDNKPKAGSQDGSK